jgi:exodeoxyribonuclease-3
VKLISWNINGIRAVVKKGFFDFLDSETPDILCLQETKAHEDQLDETILTPAGYYTFWCSGLKRGYSGVATFTRRRPRRVLRGTEVIPRDTEGRILMTEHDDFVLFNIYFPNGGRGEERLRYKLEFYEEILEHFESLRAKRVPIVFCGDVNTAHCEIDIHNPKDNETTSGFMPIERAWIDKVVGLGYIDTFRHFHPGEINQYSWWDLRTRARERNVGWRLDYFFVTPDLAPRLKSASIEMDVMGSDHAPVVLELRT